MSELPADEMQRWAAAHAPDVLERARAEALDVARDVLRERFVRALLAAAEEPRLGDRDDRGRGAGSAERVASSTAEPDASSTAPGGSGGGHPPTSPAAESALWVYGVVPREAADPPVGAAGIDGRPVEVVHDGRLAALVTRVPLESFGPNALERRLNDLEALESLARGHEAVLDAAVAHGDVLPLRLCSIYASAERVREMLEQEGSALHSALAAVAGKAELGVKAFLEASAEPAPAVAGAAPATGADYLARKREAREQRAGREDAVETTVAAIHARLAERASAARLSRPHDRGLSGRDAEMVLNAAYLVRREDIPTFEALVEELADAHRRDELVLELTGPWPPYHFVEVPAP